MSTDKNSTVSHVTNDPWVVGFHIGMKHNKGIKSGYSSDRHMHFAKKINKY